MPFRHGSSRGPGPGENARGFSLVELLVVIGILSLLVSIVMPSLSAAKAQARRTVCAINLRGLNQAFMLYLECNEMKYFPYRENLPAGTLWYWGLEPADALSAEGTRPIDTEKARLAPYFEADRAVQVCPEALYASPFKPKFKFAGYGYAINKGMLDGMGPTVPFVAISEPSATIAWADSMQINTWQAPASPTNPMLEDWYYLENSVATPATFHFRHRELCNAAFADSSVRAIDPYILDARCDGLVGRPEPPVPPSRVSPMLKLDK